MLSFVILIPFLSMCASWSVLNESLIKNLAMNSSVILYLLGLWLILIWMSCGVFNRFGWFKFESLIHLDGLGVYFILLTSFLVVVCILSSWNSYLGVWNFWVSYLFLLEACLLCIFMVGDILLFYVFFELTLIRMFLIVVLFGGGQVSVSAGYQLFLYTLVGSLLMLLVMFGLKSNLGSTSLVLLECHSLRPFIEDMFWLGVCLALSIKVRLFRFHSWLPQAHVQARTEGSMMLAGVLLKLGGFGFLKMSFPLFSLSSLNFCRLMLSLGVVGCVFTSLMTLKQLDFKSVIAYASMGHMAISISALFSSSLFGLVGGVLLLLSHGLVSAGLFFLVGVVYISLGSSNIKYYGGLLIVMRLFSVFFVLFSLSNISVRGLVTFLAEFLIFLGLMSISFVSSVFAALVIVLGAGYTIWLVSKVLFGQPCNSLLKTTDLTFSEFSICFLLFSPVLILGFVPMRLISLLSSSLYSFVLF